MHSGVKLEEADLLHLSYNLMKMSNMAWHNGDNNDDVTQCHPLY